MVSTDFVLFEALDVFEDFAVLLERVAVAFFFAEEALLVLDFLAEAGFGATPRSSVIVSAAMVQPSAGMFRCVHKLMIHPVSQRIQSDCRSAHGGVNFFHTEKE